MERSEFLKRLERATCELHKNNWGDTKKRIVGTLKAGFKSEYKEPGSFCRRIHTMPKCGSGGWMIATFFMHLMNSEDMFGAARKAQQSFHQRYGQGTELPHINGLMLAFHVLGSIDKYASRTTMLDKMDQSRRILQMIGSKDDGVRSMIVMLEGFTKPL